MNMQTKTKPNKIVEAFVNLPRNQVFIPLVALLLLGIFNLITDPSFFSVAIGQTSAGNTVLKGQIISVLDYGSELAILAIGMTLVTAASGGQDISVGATMAIAGSVILRILSGGETQPSALHAPIIIALLAAIVVSMLFGAFNGTLVACFKIQPMVATLILFTAGRSIAAWINHNTLPVISSNCSETLLYFGNTIPGIPIPTPVFITIACIIIMALVLKFTNIGLYTQSVGINEKSSRLNGINPTFIKILAFVILGLCVAIAGFIKVTRLGTINYSNTAKDIEMDAILAVALGGNALGGGKFSMVGSIVGAYVIQFLTTTLYGMEVSSEALSAYKAVVVILLVVFSAPVVRERISKVFKRFRSRTKEVA